MTDKLNAETLRALDEGQVKTVARAMRDSHSGENRLGWHEPTVQQSEHMARAAILAMAEQRDRQAEAIALVIEHFDGKRPDKLWMETERVLRALGKDQA